MSAFCRDCLVPAAAVAAGDRCASCGSPRLLDHPELSELSLAHIDCDAFYAAVEKRDDPALENRPVIIGGGRRGVVATACYLARMNGVHSAMPMFKALRLCPDATVLRPNMAKYQAVSREVRTLMAEITPMVEPLSIDEAFLDLAGTGRLHGQSAARTLAALANRVEQEIGITLSIGLSYNKFLAKLASDLDKPRGFAVIGRAEAVEFLAPRPVGDIWGVGRALQRRLAADGIDRIGQFRRFDETELIARYGAIGRRLAAYSEGRDGRQVTPHAPAKSISAETTFDIDLAGAEQLLARLWPLCEKVSERLKRNGLAGRTITLKLKTARFASRTRSLSLGHPTQLAELLYREALPLVVKQADGTEFRLIGIGVSALGDAADADPPDLLDPGGGRMKQVEQAIDTVRARFGGDAIGKGRGIGRRDDPLT